jgi:parallel beta-helix repeat protein
MKLNVCRVFATLACSLFLPMAVLAQGVGATLPFTSYEAETGTVGGGATIISLTSAPTAEFSSAALEASGHAYVQLTGPGQFVQWTNNTGQPITFINLRESIPDAPAGGGITATLNLYVNGVFRQALNLNSKQSWLYEGNNNYNGNDQNPADGDPRVFFDESHTFITGAPIAPGSTFSVQEDASNTASFYYIDAIDVENPPAPLTQPANSISITSCGAVADNTPTNGAADPAAVDSTAAIQNCINQAQSQGKILWIPQGTFYLIGTQGLSAVGITIEGAGMWYSTIYREIPLPNSPGLAAAFSVTSCTIENLHIDSNAQSRATVDGGGGAMDTTGTNWLANGMWNQHVESGCWASGTGGTVENSRFTAIWADGCNLNNVSLTGTVGNNLTEKNNFFRGTGDDAMAINSVAYNDNSDGSTTTYTAMSNITFTNNTIVAPWGGKGIGIYGSTGSHVENNYISDTARYIGLGVGRFGVNGSDLHTPTVTGNVVVRSGGNGYGQGQPALQIGNGGDGQSVGIVDGATVTGNTVIDSVYDGIGFSTSTNTLLENNTVTSPWRNGIVIAPPFYAAPTGSATITDNTVTGVGVAEGNLAYVDNSSAFVATLSGNSWQGTTPVEGPYDGTPAPIPGTVLAENYDTGGQGLAYDVSSINGVGNSYRSDGVDLETTSAPGGGNDLGWTTGGQWFRYTVNVATAGTYTVTFEIAAPSAVSDAFHLANSAGTNLSGSVNLPATGGFETWSTATATVVLPAGRQVLTLDEDNGGWNYDAAVFALVPPPEGPFGGTPAAIPGTIKAENYDTGGQGVGYSVTVVDGTDNSYRSDGVDLETTTASGGGNDLGWAKTGQWFNYTVNVATAGRYTVSFLVASNDGATDAFHLSNSSGTNLTGSVNVPNTGGWETWKTVTATVTLPAGKQVLTLNQDNPEWNFYSATFATSTSTEGPFGGTAAAIPGTVKAENYDTGGQSLGYSVLSVNGTDNSYRTDGVDLETTEATGGGNDLGWAKTGQWFRYTVNVATAGTYTVSFLVASNDGATDAFHLSNSSGTNLTGSMNVPNTGGWETWKTVTATVTLPAGVQTLTLNQDNAEWNFYSATFAAAAEGPFGGTAAAIPGTVKAENYDLGGQGVGYSVLSVNGTDNSYRSDGVDLETTEAAGGGNDLGWAKANQWFRYTVNVATAGTYTVSFLVASNDGATDAFHLSNAVGTNLTGSVNVPNTGGWETWKIVTATVTLPAGVQTLTLNQDNAEWNIYSAAFAVQ